MSELEENMKVFNEFVETKLDDIADNCIYCTVTEKDAEAILMHPVKEISAWIPKKAVPDHLLPYIENKFCMCFIIGAAFPSLEGWEIIAHPETRFIAHGFTENLNSPFRIEKVGEKESQWVDDKTSPVPNPDDIYMVKIEYTDALALRLSSIARGNSKPYS